MNNVTGVFGKKKLWLPISPKRAHKMIGLSSKDGLLHDSVSVIDVRTPIEFIDIHIAGAKLVPINEIDSRHFSSDNQQGYIIYSRSGQRSRQACDQLSKMGIAVFNLDRGLDAWIDEGLDTEKG